MMDMSLYMILFVCWFDLQHCHCNTTTCLSSPAMSIHVNMLKYTYLYI